MVDEVVAVGMVGKLAVVAAEGAGKVSSDETVAEAVMAVVLVATASNLVVEDVVVD